MKTVDIFGAFLQNIFSNKRINILSPVILDFWKNVFVAL